MDLPTLLIGIIVGAIAGISFLYLYFRRILKKHSSSIPRGVSNIKRSTLKAVNKSELETAKRTLDSTLLEKELSGQALTRLYEAEVEGRITKDQRDVLSEKYRTQLKSIGDKIGNSEILIEVGELEVLKTELISLFENKTKQVDERLESARIKLGSLPGRPIPTVGIVESKPVNKTPEKPKIKEDVKVDDNVNKLREEVLDALARLEQMDIEG